MKNTTAIIRMLSIAVIIFITMLPTVFCQQLPGAGSCPAGTNCFTVNITPSAGKQIKIRLPKDIRSNDVITGTVIEENMTAATPGTRSSSTLEGMVIEIDGKQTKLSQRIFSFIVPAGSASIPFSIKTIEGEVVQSGQLPVGGPMYDLLSDLWWREPTGGLYNVPPVAQPGQSIPITGSFDGNATNTKISLNGKPCEIIAESPRISFVTIPQEATAGAFEIRIEENNNKEASKVNIINLDLTANKTSLRKGEKTTINVTVSGLQGLDLRNGNTLKLSLENQSPQTIVFSNEAGNIITKDINEGSVNDGKYGFSTRIAGLTSGSFSITSNVAAAKDEKGCLKKYQDCMAQVKADTEKGIKACQAAGGKGVDDCISKVNTASAKLEQACLDEYLNCAK